MRHRCQAIVSIIDLMKIIIEQRGIGRPIEEDRIIQAPVEVLAVLVAGEPALEQPCAMEEREEEEEDVPVPSSKRRRRRSEAATLNSQLGKYWVIPTRPRRGTRVRRQPERYTP